MWKFRISLWYDQSYLAPVFKTPHIQAHLTSIILFQPWFFYHLVHSLPLQAMFCHLPSISSCFSTLGIILQEPSLTIFAQGYILPAQLKFLCLWNFPLIFQVKLISPFCTGNTRTNSLQKSLIMLHFTWALSSWIVAMILKIHSHFCV